MADSGSVVRLAQPGLAAGRVEHLGAGRLRAEDRQMPAGRRVERERGRREVHVDHPADQGRRAADPAGQRRALRPAVGCCALSPAGLVAVSIY
jgi:hypothetical protein